MLHLFSNINFNTAILLILAFLFVLIYEAINGFHDTANAVAMVIYTRAIKIKLAVVIAGIFNFLGVMLGGLSVAYTIVHLLPTKLLLNINSTQGLVMVFCILLAAIIWNLITWYFGLPASSSHTLIGTIIGVSTTNAILTHTSIVDALNISKMISILLSLVFSPFLGLIISGGLIFFMRRYLEQKTLDRISMTPVDREKIDGKKQPPFWIRVTLVVSSIGVSYSHGANDGQKGIGLIMLVLIGLIPSSFIVNLNATNYEIRRTYNAVENFEKYYYHHNETLSHVIQMKVLKSKKIFDLKTLQCDQEYVLTVIKQAQKLLNNIENYNQLKMEQRIEVRRLLSCITNIIDKISTSSYINKNDQKFLKKLKNNLLNTLEYAPIWIIISVALAISLGTMFGWQRVATTIGEKIGKEGMTYAQGVSAQLTSAVSIGVASYIGMPVSTPYILSSSVVGAIIGDGGKLQHRTIKNIVSAWILTLPISICLSSILYWSILKCISL